MATSSYLDPPNKVVEHLGRSVEGGVHLALCVLPQGGALRALGFGVEGHLLLVEGELEDLAVALAVAVRLVVVLQCVVDAEGARGVADGDVGVVNAGKVPGEAAALLGCQFHPEKSGKAGARILANFLKI